MDYLARSADLKRDIPHQTYLDHVLHVLVRSKCYFRKILKYTPEWKAHEMRRVLELAAEYHDLGKLNEENQRVLRGEKKAARLPVYHDDAGVAHLIAPEQDAWTSALLIYAHHKGLPDCTVLANHGIRNPSVEHLVNQELSDLLKRHESSVRRAIVPKASLKITSPLSAADIRILFSCLTHADHGDAARASNDEPQNRKPPKLRPEERLEALRRYVDQLSSDGDQSERNQMRAQFFDACSIRSCDDTLVYCDAPVGTGKTTAVMSHLLGVAARRGLRRIFVILPFTNIITQSVKTYREALVLEGEKDVDVVAEIHHRADFKDRASRKFTALWDAPIVVTTAVAFFETLASASPSALRRLQNLPGSAIFLDEAHAMLPVKLLPLAWEWIQHASKMWSCHWVFASGSLCHFWKLDEFQKNSSVKDISSMIPEHISSKLQTFEVERVSYKYVSDPMTLNNFVKWLYDLEGPILVVLNTVQNAAIVARYAEGIFGSGNVLHLSSALTPNDREITLDLVRARLKYKAHNQWCLISTSCVEAGIDFSFRTGVRECSSLLSLLQLAGRINRNSTCENATVWSFEFAATVQGITQNPAFNVSRRILRDFFEQNKDIVPSLSTDAMKRELREQGAFSEKLSVTERSYNFQTVQKEFKVIEDETELTVIDPALIHKIKSYDDIHWTDLQKGSIRLRKNLINKLAIEKSQQYPDLYLWPDSAAYSPFLGYMEAVLQLFDFNDPSTANII